MDKITLNAIKQLSESNMWDVVRDTFLIPHMKELLFITSIDKSLDDKEYKIEALARALAFEKLNEMITDIDRSKNLKTEAQQENSFE